MIASSVSLSIPPAGFDRVRGGGNAFVSLSILPGAPAWLARVRGGGTGFV